MQRSRAARAASTASYRRRTSPCQKRSRSSSHSTVRRISASAAPRVASVSAAKRPSACSRSPSASMARTSAELTSCSAALAEVVASPLRLPQQEGDLLIGRLHELLEYLRGLLELLLEASVLLVPPALAEVRE